MNTKTEWLLYKLYTFFIGKVLSRNHDLLDDVTIKFSSKSFFTFEILCVDLNFAFICKSWSDHSIVHLSCFILNRQPSLFISRFKFLLKFVIHQAVLISPLNYSSLFWVENLSKIFQNRIQSVFFDSFTIIKS